MSYTPTEWKTGDIVSSQRLNKLEEGVRDAYEVMVINDTNNTLDKTWQEIYDAMSAGTICTIKIVKAGIGRSGVSLIPAVDVTHDEMAGDYTVTAIGTDAIGTEVSTQAYKTETETGYPVHNEAQ